MCGAVNVVVSKSQRSIKKFLIGWEANCSTTGQVMDEVTVAHGPGNLSRRWLSFFSDQDFTVDLGNGSHAQGHITYHGRLSRRTRKGSGDFNITFAVVDPSGAQVDTCSTGQVTWTANPVKKGS
jgi:hypothetical protein